MTVIARWMLCMAVYCIYCCVVWIFSEETHVMCWFVGVSPFLFPYLTSSNGVHIPYIFCIMKMLGAGTMWIRLLPMKVLALTVS